MIVVWQAREDLLLAKLAPHTLTNTPSSLSLSLRAPLLIPCTHWIAQYILYDHYAMYDSDYHRKELWKHPSLYTRFVVFARKKWSVILHHTLLLGFGYALVVVSNGSAKFCECTNICGIQYPGIRSGKCDFIIGTFFLRELWNPFQNLAKLLKQVSMYIEYLCMCVGMVKHTL